MTLENKREDSRDVTDPIALTRQSQYLLGLLGQRYVQYYPALASLSNVKAALMLGHALYWTRHWLINHPEREGWFWKTATEWQGATSLSTDEQKSARAILTRLNLLEEKKQGMPAKLYYRVNLNQLGYQLSVRAATQYSEWNWEDALVRTLLGRPVVFYKPLADIAGGAAAGLYLSHLLSVQRLALMHGDIDRRGFFHLAIQRTQTFLALGPKSVRNARQRLRTIKLLSETWTNGLQPKLLSKLHLDILFAQLQAYLSRSDISTAVKPVDFKGMAKTANPVSGKGQGLNAANVHSSLAAFPKQGTPNSQSKNQEKGMSIYGVNTLQNKRQQQLSHAVSLTDRQVDTSSCGVDEISSSEANPPSPTHLILPTSITDLERQAVIQMVSRVPADLQQYVLDEWAWQLTNPGKTIINRIGYLRPIINSAQAGTFIPTVALAMADSRIRQAEYEARKQEITRQAHESALCRRSSNPEAGSIREQELAAIRKILPRGRRT